MLNQKMKNMLKTTKIIIVVLLLSFTMNAEGQIKVDLKKKLENAVNRRANQKTDQAIDKGLDSVENAVKEDMKKDAEKSSENQGNQEGQAIHWFQGVYFENSHQGCHDKRACHQTVGVGINHDQNAPQQRLLVGIDISIDAGSGSQ